MVDEQFPALSRIANTENSSNTRRVQNSKQNANSDVGMKSDTITQSVNTVSAPVQDSVTGSNCKDLVVQADVDGFLEVLPSMLVTNLLTNFISNPVFSGEGKWLNSKCKH